MSKMPPEVFIRKLVQGAMKNYFDEANERFKKGVDHIEEGELESAANTLTSAAASMRVFRSFTKQLGKGHNLYKSVSTAYNSMSNLSQDLLEERMTMTQLLEEGAEIEEELSEAEATAEALQSAEGERASG